LSFTIPLAPRSTLFPYTTLFRSHGVVVRTARRGRVRQSSGTGVLHGRRNRRRRRKRQAVGAELTIEEERNANGDRWLALRQPLGDRKSTRLNSSHRTISYAVFCL